jgi:hypothetical protein
MADDLALGHDRFYLDRDARRDMPKRTWLRRGSGLMGIASVVALLREPFVIPRHFWGGFLPVAVCSSWQGRMQNSTKKASLFFAVIAVIVSGVILYFR